MLGIIGCSFSLLGLAGFGGFSLLVFALALLGLGCAATILVGWFPAISPSPRGEHFCPVGRLVWKSPRAEAGARRVTACGAVRCFTGDGAASTTLADFERDGIPESVFQ